MDSADACQTPPGFNEALPLLRVILTKVDRLCPPGPWCGAVGTSYYRQADQVPGYGREDR